jgi:hypothetical protein
MPVNATWKQVLARYAFAAVFVFIVLGTMANSPGALQIICAPDPIIETAYGFKCNKETTP